MTARKMPSSPRINLTKPYSRLSFYWSETEASRSSINLGEKYQEYKLKMYLSNKKKVILLLCALQLLSCALATQDDGKLKHSGRDYYNRDKDDCKCQDGIRTGWELKDPNYCYEGKRESGGCKNCKVVQGWECKVIQECKDGSRPELYKCKRKQPKPTCEDGIRTGWQLYDPNYCYEGKRGTPGCRNCKIVEGWECKVIDQCKDGSRPELYKCKRKVTCEDGIRTGWQLKDPNYCYEGKKQTEGCQNCKVAQGWECKLISQGKDGKQIYKCKRKPTCQDGYRTGWQLYDPNYCYEGKRKSGGCENCKIVQGWECKVIEECKDGSKQEIYKCYKKPTCEDGYRTGWQLKDPNYCYQGKRTTPGCQNCKIAEGWECKVIEECKDGSKQQIYKCYRKPTCEDGYRTGWELKDPDYCYEGKRKSGGCENCKVVQGWECNVIEECKDGSKQELYKCKRKPTCQDGIRTGFELLDPNYCYEGPNGTPGCKNCKVSKGWTCKVVQECKDGSRPEVYKCRKNNLDKYHN